MPSFEYAKWDGSQGLQDQAAESLFDKLAEFMLRYGDQVVRNLDRIEEQDPEIVDLLQKKGLIEKDGEGKFRVAPGGIRRIQEGALGDLFQAFNRDGIGKHDTPSKGAGTVRHEDTRPYVFGDSLAHLNMAETLKNALARQGPGTPIKVRQDDFAVYETEYQANCATVLLIDMSGSMTRYGKYAAAKKVALALQALVRIQYPQDTLKLVGFHTLANELTERKLIDSSPMPVGIYDSRVRLRLSLDQPLPRQVRHFTNIQAGLKLARNMLARSGASNKQIIVVTDGEPTAHLEDREVVLIYPPAERTAMHTLAEVKRCAASGIRVSGFALIEDYFYLGLVNFVEEMAKVSRGIAAYCSSDELGTLVIDSFVGGRRQRRMSR